MKKPHLEPGTPGPKQVGIWIRVSTEDQVKGESPEHHERRARAYAEVKGWNVREVYRLDAVSGKSVMSHREAERMLRHIASGHITALIFSKLARLARNTRELLDFADRFREHGADLVSLQESIDTTTPAGRLFYTMIAARAQWEREEISERVAASVPIRAKLGKSLGGLAPYGYQWKNHQLVPNPEEVPVRRLLHELFLEHRRLKTVARILNQRGYRTRKGVEFTGTEVKRLLLDPTAKGVRRANYTRSTGKGSSWVLKPRDEWVLVPVEPIIPVELWEQCHALLEERRSEGTAPARKASHLFTGFVRCSCGQRMYVPWRSPRYVCYGCRTKILAEDLEAIFREQLRSFLVSPEDLARHLGQADAEIQTREERLAALEGEAGRVRSDIEKLFRLYHGDYLSPDGFARQHGPLEVRQGALEAEIPRLRGELDFLKIQYLSRDEILAGAQDLHERWPKLTFEEQRAIVEAVVRGITVGKEEVEVDLAYFPDSSEIAAQRPRILRGARPLPASPTSAPPT
jgi:site-specific DNA recombinase